MPANNREFKVFLCHAVEDKPMVRKLYQRLKSDGIEAWLDEINLLPGQVWRVEIPKIVRASRVVIVCISSKSANKEGFVQAEIRYALEKAFELPEGTIYIIPAKLEDCIVPDSLEHLQCVNLFEKGGYNTLLDVLCHRAEELGITLHTKENLPVNKPLHSLVLERLVSEQVLRTWFGWHGLIANPFGSIDINSNPFYPEGAARPTQWEAFMDPVPLLAHCQTTEDAQALVHLLRKECLQMGKPDQYLINRWIFPTWLWPQTTTPVQSPLLTIAHATAQSWLDFLAVDTQALLRLSVGMQNALLELLCWSFGSNEAIIIWLQANGLKEDDITPTLIRIISEFKSEFAGGKIPRDPILLSWSKTRPANHSQTFLILPGDHLQSVLQKGWYEQFRWLLSTLYLNGIITKIVSSTILPASLDLQEIELSWSDGLDGRLSRSLQGQFDAAIAPDQKVNGVAIRFHELFGPGTTEEQTTGKLISTSSNSLARMLTLGNSLLQYHCGKHGVSEKYLYPADLEYILNTA